MADNWTDLAGSLIKAGAPLIGGALAGRLGESLGANLGGLAAEVLGVPPTPAAVATALEQPDSAERLRHLDSAASALIAQEAAAMTARIDDWSLFKDGWRPALCWLAGLAWAQALIIAPWVAACGYRMPAIPTDHLATFTTVLLAVLGLGHTAKYIFGQGGLKLKGNP